MCTETEFNIIRIDEAMPLMGVNIKAVGGADLLAQRETASLKRRGAVDGEAHLHY